MSRAHRVRSRAALLVGVALAGACGGGEPAEESSAMPTAEEFVPPRDADILLAELISVGGGLPTIGAPTNLTQRPDYDNQPHFTPDGSGLWYTANDPQSGQSDIWRYDFASSMVARVTMSSPESEYSATPLPDGSGISTIRVEADSTQRLWRFGPDGQDASVLLPGLAPVGYHAWVDEQTVVMFVLGDPPTLRRGDLRTERIEVIAEDIGRSIQRIPGTFDISYVQRHDDGRATIMRLPGDGGSPEPIAEALAGGEDHAWTPDRILLMADGATVHARRIGPDEAWQQIADFSDLHVLLSRLAVSPDGTQIAMVAELDALELPAN